MRDHLLFFVNGQRHRVSGPDCFLNLSDYLRRRCGLVGTKIVCSEGDCGACSVLVGRPSGGALRYQAIDSCIQFVFQLEGAHIVTVEGLAPSGVLTPVQQAMVDCHGSQCGFCTPGFVVAMTGLLEEESRLNRNQLRDGLTGNLCRCTGYVPIIQAGLNLDTDALARLNQLYPPEPILAGLESVRDESLAVSAPCENGTRQLLSPTSLSEALALLDRHPEAKIVAGATDVGVQWNKGLIDPQVILDLNRVDALRGVHCQADQLVAGARATWTEIEEICRNELPEFYEIVRIFGAPQIRHVGTLGGNIINASPIADSLPLMMVMEAELDLVSQHRTRTVGITDFYLGYKQFDLQPGELLRQVRIPLPAPSDLLRLVKVSRRRDLDIATFTAAILMRLDGETIAEARVALGAVGPTVVRATATEDFLQGQPFSEATMRRAGEVATGEIAPISDVRGSQDFRYQLTRNVFLRFYHEQVPVAP